ncbi:Uncharacterised protein [Chlamydia trachomatis]|nr:Uncharacterised protein [Chlamydia trachomatis]
MSSVYLSELCNLSSAKEINLLPSKLKCFLNNASCKMYFEPLVCFPVIIPKFLKAFQSFEFQAFLIASLSSLVP